MPAERLSMRQIREVLRLCFESRLPQRAVARSLGLSQGAVSGYLSRARAVGVAWPLSEDLDDVQLEALLFPPPSGTPADQRPMPDWGWVHRELRRPDVTLALLWEEYRAGAVDGFSYSWFCDLYRAWTGRLKPTMRQVHVAGERMFVDFAGRTGEVVDANTGEIIPVQIFVAVLGASSGIGKSWLACALGHKACREGFSVLYKRAGRLFGDLSQARGEGRLPRLLTMLERVRLLIIDDWGPEPLNAEQRRDLLEIVDDRYDRGSLLITSQVPVSRWHEVIGDPTLADATLDRIVHRAHRIELKGPSLRRQLVAAESPAA